MRHLRTPAILLACLLFAAPAAQAGWSGSLGQYSEAWNINLHLGQKALDEDDWSPADTALGIGIDYDHTPRDWALGWTLSGYYDSADEKADDLKVRATLYEIDAGVRKVFYSRRGDTDWFRPYLGGGLAAAWASAKTTPGDTNSGYGLGGWLGGGFYVTLYKKTNVGLDIRYSSVAVDLDGITVDGGGIRFSLVIGYHGSEN